MLRSAHAILLPTGRYAEKHVDNSNLTQFLTFKGTPGQPYGSTLRDCLRVEKSMIRRRHQVEGKLKPDELLVSYSTFPRLGCPKFTGEFEIRPIMK